MRIAEVMGADDRDRRIDALVDELRQLKVTACEIRKRREWGELAKLQKLTNLAGKKAAGP